MQIWESLLQRRVQLALLTAKQCRRLDCKTKPPFSHCSSLLSWIPATENIDTTKSKRVALVSISYYCYEPLIFGSPVVPRVSCHCYGFIFVRMIFSKYVQRSHNNSISHRINTLITLRHFNFDMLAHCCAREHFQVTYWPIRTQITKNSWLYDLLVVLYPTTINWPNKRDCD